MRSPLSGKETRAALPALLDPPPRARSGTSPTRRAGHRTAGAPAPGEGTAAASQAPSAPPPRPGPAGGGEPGHVQEHVVLVRREAGDAPPVAPGARRQEVDVQEERSSGPAIGRPRGPGSHRSPRQGEPPVGVPEDPGRAAEAREPSLGDHGWSHPAPPRPGSGTPPIGSHLVRVPPITGGG